jgi:type III secretion protein R
MNSMARRSVFLLLLTACPAVAQPLEPLRVASPVVLMLIIGAISLAPFLAIVMTSFVKISIVLGLVKTGLGAQAPASQVTNALAIILTLFVMAPVAQRMYTAAEIRDPNSGVFATENLTALYGAVQKGKEPLRVFLLKHAQASDRELFLSLSHTLDPANGEDAAAPAPTPATGALRPDEEFRIVLPAFVTSELKSAFQVGFMLLLPFLIVDIVIANVLVAAGLNMIQPAFVSLPVKLALFVAADGWRLIIKGLVLSYA